MNFGSQIKPGTQISVIRYLYSRGKLGRVLFEVSNQPDDWKTEAS